MTCVAVLQLILLVLRLHRVTDRLRGKQHAKADKGDDQPARNAQAGNRDAEGIEHRVARIPGHHHNGENIDRGLQRLAVALAEVHFARQPQEQRHGGERVSERQQHDQP